MAIGFSNTNKPINPRGQDASPKGYNKAELFSGKALDFDGVNDNIAFTDFQFTAGNKYSLCIYANRDGSGMIWSKDNQWMEIGFTSGGAVQLRTYDTGWNTYILIDIVPANEWHQIIITYDVNANTWESYLNGQFVKSITAAEPDNKIINRIGSTSSKYYDGEFANAKIFEVELTAAQVADLYNNPEKIVPTGVSNDALKLWLPMQEGAGTTAYDGSGNGNHGTIAGATYTHGIGAPVAQTAVIDWNKGSNIVTYSEDLTQWGTNDSPVVTASSTIAPDGSTNAYEITDNTSSGYARIKSNTVTMSGDYIGSVYIKKTTGSLSHYPGFDIGSPGHYVIVDTTNGTAVDTGSHYSDIAVTSYNDTWWRVSAKGNVTTTNNAIKFWPALSDNGTTISAIVTGSNTFWGAQVEQATAIGSYVYTGATAQTSDVLLPAGLTTGRDITGVNLFENVRKQGALNLDGNSWAEVHDNASFDLAELSLECWFYAATTIASDGLLGQWVGNQGYLLYAANGSNFAFYVDSQSVNYLTALTGWNHIVGVYNGEKIQLYINGAKEAESNRTADPTLISAPIEIGRFQENVSTQYGNQIAQRRIYNRALTASEVLRNYNSSKNTYK